MIPESTLKLLRTVWQFHRSIFYNTRLQVSCLPWQSGHWGGIASPNALQVVNAARLIVEIFP
ncbi:MAG: hypothetical protein M2R46_01134 [Verrucomicrobia subdivision 3 bacterium]|nr:hypothetical protein [Limisphaerales bacterium]